MKLSNKHNCYNACCAGCIAATEQRDIDPEKYLEEEWLCNRCREELSKMPPRFQEAFDALEKKSKETIKYYKDIVDVLENYMRKNGLNPDEAGRQY
jgi:hypothetical protein